MLGFMMEVKVLVVGEAWMFWVVAALKFVVAFLRESNLVLIV